MVTPDNTVSCDAFEGRKETCDERFSRDQHMLEKHDEEIRSVREQTIQMSEMIKRHDAEQKSHTASQQNQATRIDTLERKPGDQYGKVKTAIMNSTISAFVGGQIAFVLSMVLNTP